MAVDTATTISAFDTTKPVGNVDPASELDNNIRHIKTVLKSNFPAIAGAVSASDVELSYVDGVTSAIQTQIDLKSTIASPTFTGVPAAPTAAAATSTTQLATTAFVQTALASVNTQSPLTISIDGSAAVTASAGQHVVATNVAAVPVTLPASPAAGDRVRVTWTNGLVTNSVDPGANKIRTTSGVMTVNRLTLDLEFTYTNAAWGWSF